MKNYSRKDISKTNSIGLFKNGIYIYMFGGIVNHYQNQRNERGTSSCI